VLPGQHYAPEDILRIAWNRRWLILAPLVVAVAGAALFTAELPNRYRSETVILVVPQRVPESYVRSTVTSRIEDRLKTIQPQILSRSNLESIIRALDLYPEERKTLVMEDVVALMRLDIEGPSIERGDAFRVGYVSTDPKLAQQVTERLASLYIAENLKERELQAEGTTQFLVAQVEDARQRLVEHEKKLEQFRRQHDGELPTQVEGNHRAVQAAQTRIQAIEEALYRDRELRLSLERQIADLDANTQVLSEPASATTVDRSLTTAEQLAVARAQLAALELKYKSGHPDIAAAKRRIRDLELRYSMEEERRPADTPPPIDPAIAFRENRRRDLQEQLTSLQNRQARQEAEVDRLEAEMATYKTRMEAAPGRESDLIELTRDYATLQNTYTSLRGKLEESKLAANLEKRQVSEQFRILDPPRFPERPYGPNRLRIITLAAMCGLLCGLTFAGALEYFDESFESENEIVRVLQVPVLARVRMMSSERELQARTRQRILASLAVAIVLAASAGTYAAWKLQLF
jgi:polysaccharide chain length determinant protein (PEP-CTERM system associated)